MSEQDGTTTPETAETADDGTENTAPEGTSGPQGDQDGQDSPKPRRPASDDLKADLAKERRERQALQRELQKLKDRDLSELERAQKAAKEAETRLAQLESEAMRQRVALKAGIPAEHIHRLQGSTEDELAADAAELAKLLAPKGPRPDPSQGSRGGQQPADMNAMIRRMAGFQR